VTDPTRIRRTDPGEPERCPVYAIHGCFTPACQQDEIAHGCRTASIGCVECKRILADEVIAELAPIQARRADLLAHPKQVLDVFAQGAITCRSLARETMLQVRALMGID